MCTFPRYCIFSIFITKRSYHKIICMIFFKISYNLRCTFLTTIIIFLFAPLQSYTIVIFKFFYSITNNFIIKTFFFKKISIAVPICFITTGYCIVSIFINFKLKYLERILCCCFHAIFFSINCIINTSTIYTYIILIFMRFFCYNTAFLYLFTTPFAVVVSCISIYITCIFSIIFRFVLFFVIYYICFFSFF